MTTTWNVVPGWGPGSQKGLWAKTKDIWAILHCQYYLAFKKEILQCVTTWLECENIALSEISKDKYCMIPLIWGMEIVKLTEAESRMVVAEGWQVGEAGNWFSVWTVCYAGQLSSGDPLSNNVPIDKTVLHIGNFVKRISLMLNVLTTIKFENFFKKLKEQWIKHGLQLLMY